MSMTAQQRPLSYIIVLLGIIGCFACNESKYLGDGLPLYAANKVVIKPKAPEDKITKKKQKALNGELNELLRPLLESLPISYGNPMDKSAKTRIDQHRNFRGRY